MEKGLLYAIVAVLAIVVVGGGMYLYQEETKPGIELKANSDGVSLEAK